MTRINDFATPNLTPPYAIELVNYQLNDGINSDAFLAVNRQAGEEFTSKQPGFIHRGIGKSDDGTWLIAITWKTAEDARNSITNIETVPDVVQTYLSMINRGTLDRLIFDVVCPSSEFLAQSFI